MKKIIGLAVLMSAFSLTAQSFEFDEDKLYAGGGLGYSNHDVSGVDNAIGFQFFGGYDLSDDVKIGDKISLAAELGYATSGDFESSNCPTGFTCIGESANGLWANAVIDYDIDGKISILGRAGLDFGDDDGLMFGVGGGYKIDDKLSARLEYVTRDHYSSLQANVVYDF
ncbi:MAG: porin family protein [Gammaproteobacteria bacterium]|nr:porin family protein [Gammaproteobacteria bacterium]